jgi:hypothetical protein
MVMADHNQGNGPEWEIDERPDARWNPDRKKWICWDIDGNRPADCSEHEHCVDVKTNMQYKAERKAKDLGNLALLLEKFFQDNLDMIIYNFVFRLVVQGKTDMKTFDFLMDHFYDVNIERAEWGKVQLEIDRLKRIYGPALRVELPKKTTDS